ncbi:MAG TPA: NAD(P) transhydrogenase subunit alpha [Phycisphaerales bacterium]|nr:NAD(P) transhydrogenase subunit alpha [Phycisphaerales bacterium]HMP38444.1 NAD(P) transhydrogenase subunit alpha [Phycisphaerales bacterium]
MSDASAPTPSAQAQPTIGVVRERAPRERRVALVPSVVGALRKGGADVLVEAGAGSAAGFPDAAYSAEGAHVLARAEVLARATVLCAVRGPSVDCAPGAGEDGGGAADLDALRRDPASKRGVTLVGMLDPLGTPGVAGELARRGITAFALELLPRTTRAQAMDVLSSQATAAGYAAVLLAASSLPRFLPMFMTAAGTVPASRVLVIGAGVAGLQAIATARRLGAIVSAYDVRSAVKEQIESLGARFVELFAPGEVAAAEGGGGYARAMDEAFYERQRTALAKVCHEQDIVITTAAIPGRRAPLLIVRAAVEGMRPGSVIVDLAAERGGNCELARADEAVDHGGVLILGPTDLPSRVAHDASRLYARNLAAFLAPMLPGGKAPRKGGTQPPSPDASGLVIDLEDEIQRATLLCRDGEIVHEALRSAGAAEQRQRDPSAAAAR